MTMGRFGSGLPLLLALTLHPVAQAQEIIHNDETLKALAVLVGKSTVVIEVRIERRREGKEPRLAANLIVSQFILPPSGE